MALIINTIEKQQRKHIAALEVEAKSLKEENEKLNRALEECERKNAFTVSPRLGDPSMESSLEIIHLEGRLAALRAYAVLAADGDLNIVTSAHAEESVHLAQAIEPFLCKVEEELESADRKRFRSAALVEIQRIQDALTILNEARGRHFH